MGLLEVAGLSVDTNSLCDGIKRIPEPSALCLLSREHDAPGNLTTKNIIIQQPFAFGPISSRQIHIALPWRPNSEGHFENYAYIEI